MGALYGSIDFRNEKSVQTFIMNSFESTTRLC